MSGLPRYLPCSVRIVVLSLWQCRYVYAPTVAGIEGVGVEDVDEDVDDEVVESEDVVENDVVVCWIDEVLLVEPVVEVVEATDKEYRFRP